MPSPGMRLRIRCDALMPGFLRAPLVPVFHASGAGRLIVEAPRAEATPISAIRRYNGRSFRQ